jgi:hypothetical protein
MHETTVKDVKLLTEKPSESRFPDYIVKIADAVYYVEYKNKHLGEVYLKDGVWRNFTICVGINFTNNLDDCIKDLIHSW